MIETSLREQPTGSYKIENLFDLSREFFPEALFQADNGPNSWRAELRVKTTYWMHRNTAACVSFSPVAKL